MRGERGSVTLWVLGLSIMLIAFGGLAIDYWRALASQRELVAVADSAAVAGASGIDEERYRATGEVVLDWSRATALALRSIDFQDVVLTDVDVTVAPDGSAVTVSMSAAVELGLLGVLVDDDEPIEVAATATARPVRRP